MRAHPMVGDSAIAVPLAAFDLMVVIVREVEGRAGIVAVPIELLVIAATVAPLVIRRKHPVWSAYLILVLGALHAALELGLAGLITGCIALYTLVVYVGRRHAALYFGLQVVTSAIQIPLLLERDEWLVAIGFTLGVLVFSWLLGEFVGARRAYHAELEARLHLLETERDQATRIAVADERSRIARELHDVVAHSVSVMVVHADGAAYAVDQDPAAARAAVHTIAQTGRAALIELRRVLDVLRGSTDDDGEALAPQPGVGDIGRLAETVRESGLPVLLELDDDLAGLPAGFALGVYRIVQESLTNTLKHAGRGAAAEVRVVRQEDAVLVEVLDDGAGKAAPVGAPAFNGVSGGNGLIGMRERATMFGGTLDAGPRPGGGWRVAAVLPLGPDNGATETGVA